MAEASNPYRHDLPGLGPFVGRHTELKELRTSIVVGRNALAAVMGGRGMGKTALAGRLAQELAADDGLSVHVVGRVDRDPRAFVRQLEQCLGTPIDPVVFVDALAHAVQSHQGRRVVLLLDEIDGLIGSDGGRDLLENLRIAYETLSGGLAVVVFGGSRLRELLTSDVSPFLRTARWLRLTGLSLAETSMLINDPLDLRVPPSVVELLWEQTGGHPLLLQAIMERVVDSGPSTSVIDGLPAAMAAVVAEMLEPRIFPIWWDNLTVRGQHGYRTLLAMGRPLEREQWAAHLGNGPDGVVEILESTGIARVEGGRVLARSSLFCAWVARCHPLASPTPPPEETARERVFESPDATAFERFVVEKIARWARSVVEHPAPFLRANAGTDNDGLALEQTFQLGLLHALRQHDLVVEPEPLSSGRGRVDLKIRPGDALDQRACVEIKIWGRNHKNVVEQVLGYVVPGDDFACVVMLDRHRRSLRDVYLRECIPGLAEPLWHDRGASPSYPAVVTVHALPPEGSIRVYHFLVQLPQ